jgi:LysR family hydrogen peroxide-inducible transcriptional activator
VRLLDVEGWSATRSIAAAWRGGAAYAPTYQAIALRVQGEARRVLGTEQR